MTHDTFVLDDPTSPVSDAGSTANNLPPLHEVPEPDERQMSLGRRLRSPQTIISFLVAFGIVYFVFTQLDINIGDVWKQIRSASLPWLLAGFAVYYGSFPLRAARWRLLLRNAGISRDAGFAIPGLRGLSEIYVLSWFANCIVPAKLGDAYRGYLLKKHAGPSFSRTLGTIFAERLLDVVGLVTLMIAAGLLVFHGTVPSAVRWWFVAGVVLVVVGLGGLIGLMRATHHVERLLPTRVRPQFNRLSEGIITSFSRQQLGQLSALTIIIWSLEGVRVFAVAQALNVSLSIPESVFVALLASLLTTFPFTPAGLGVVESGTVIAVKLFGVLAVPATAVALLDRTIASYSVVVFGGLLYLVSRHK